MFFLLWGCSLYLFGVQLSAGNLFMPEPEDVVAHGDANLELGDFFTTARKKPVEGQE